MHDYRVSDTIEKYDSLQDTWTMMYFRMPQPTAKHGSVIVRNDGIFIVGGMTNGFEPIKEVWCLNLEDLSWSEMAGMFGPRLTSSGLFSSCRNDDTFIYAIGGN